MTYNFMISKEGLSAPDLSIVRKKKDGRFGKYIAVDLMYFGRQYEDYGTQQEKLSYLVTLAWVLDGGYDINHLEESTAYYWLKKSILAYLEKYGINDCKGIWINPKSEAIAGIDHQTINHYDSIRDFESVMEVNYEEFVFKTSNGNSRLFNML